MTTDRTQPARSERAAQISDIAARLFRERGYAAVSMRDIAMQAGLRTASLYHHYGSKDELVKEILDTGIRRVRMSVESALENVGSAASPRARLSAAVRAHLTTLHEVSDYASANVRIFGQLPKDLKSASMEERRRYEVIWSRLVNELTPGTLERARIDSFVIGALNATLEWVTPVKDDLETLSAFITTMICDGLLDAEARN